MRPIIPKSRKQMMLSGKNEQVARVRISVEETVDEDLFHQQVGSAVGDHACRSSPAASSAVEIGRLDRLRTNCRVRTLSVDTPR